MQSRRVKRDNVLGDTFHQLRQVPGAVLASIPLSVTFDGEAGIDLGGVTRDWMYLALQALLDPQVALFTGCEGNYVYQVSAVCQESSFSLAECRSALALTLLGCA
jgi:hypothetical protein